MARGKRGLHARKQPRNSRGQFAPRREVIYVDSDESGFSSAGAVPPCKCLKGGPCTLTPAKMDNKEHSSCRTQAKKNPNPSFDGKNKVNVVLQLEFIFYCVVGGQSCAMVGGSEVIGARRGGGSPDSVKGWR